MWDKITKKLGGGVDHRWEIMGLIDKFYKQNQ